MKNLFFLFIIICSYLYSQETWVQEFHPISGVGDTDYYVEDIIVCQDSGYVFNGYYTDYDPEFGIDDYWGFLIKTDSTGNLQWTELDIQTGWPVSDSYAFVETNENEYLIAGRSYLNVPHLIKRDYLGNLLWTIQYDIKVYSMCNSNDNHIILAGLTLNGNPNLRKIDSEGNTIWDKNFSFLPPSGIVSIKECQDGSLIGTGTADANNDDVFVFKTNSFGDTLWTKTLDLYGERDLGKSLTEDSDGNIMVTGYCETPSSNYTGFFWYLDSLGNTISTHEVGFDIGIYHNSITSLQNNTFTTKCFTNSGIKLYNFNSDYSINWESTFDENFGAMGDKAFCKLDEGYVVIGVKNINWEDYFVLSKADEFGQTTSINENVIPESSPFQISNYPNPFNPSTKIEFSIQNDSKVDLSIFNIKGQKIKPLTRNEYVKGSHSIIWNGDDEFGKPVSSGIYYYKLNVNGKTKVVNKCLLLK